MKQVRQLLRYLRPHRRTIALTWAMSIVVLGLQALSAWIGAGFIERLLRGEAGGAGIMAGVGALAQRMNEIVGRMLDRGSPFRSLVAAVALLVATGALTVLLRVGKTALFARIMQSVLHRIRCDVFDHLTRLDLSFSRRNRPGEVSSLLLRDVEALKMAIFDLCDRIFMQPLRLAMAVALLWSLSPRLMIVFSISLAVCGLVAHLAGGLIERQAKRSMERVARVQGFLTEYLTTVLLARSLGRETRERRRFDELCGGLAQADRELMVTNSLAPQLLSGLFVAAGAVILLFGGHMVMVSRTLEPGALLRFVLCLPIATYPVEALALLYVSCRQSMASARRVFGLFAETPAAEDCLDAIEPPRSFEFLAFREVSFRPDGHPVLEGISFEVRRGDRILLAGPSGSGKTTLLHLLAAILRPTAGRVEVDGTDLARFRGESWRRKIGIVPQEPLLMNDTIRENLKFACEGAGDERLVESLLSVKFERDETSCRLALDRAVGNRGEFLSGGERQRLAIARALLGDPALLLLDEPVAHLDEENRRRVRETIAALPRGVTILFTGHDRALHDLADHVVALENGRLASRPPPAP